MRVYIALLIEESFDEFPVRDDQRSVLESFERENAAILGCPLPEPLLY